MADYGLELPEIFRTYLNRYEQRELEKHLRQVDAAREVARAFMRKATRIKNRARKRAEMDLVPIQRRKVRRGQAHS